MGKKTTGFLAILVIILLVLNIFQFLYFTYLRPSVPAEDVPLQISELKGSGWQGYIGKTATAEGFFVELRPNVCLLLSSLDYLLLNSEIPNDKFLRISGTLPEELLANSGARIYMKGTIQSADADERVLLQYNSYKIVQAAFRRWREAIMQFEITPGLKFLRKYALLISGGINSIMAYPRYWNDLKYMYSILINHYSYNPKNIYVIYKDGVAEDSQMPVNCSASFSNLQTFFSSLALRIFAEDTLFIFTTNHGSPTGLCMYNSADVTPSQFATMLNGLGPNKMTIVMEQCYSGNFISQISGTNRVIMTACSASEVSFGCDTEGAYDEFVYHFMNAVHFQTPAGTAVDADTDDNGSVSMVEAFNYASNHDSWTAEHPHYDDNGDGTGHMATIPNGGDGTPGSTTYI